MGMLDENQFCFKRGTSTANAMQVMVRLQENLVNCNRRIIAMREGEYEKAGGELLGSKKSISRHGKRKT